MNSAPKIVPLGDSALAVDFGNEISTDLNHRAINLAEALAEDPFPGLIEAAPAYSSVAVFYDPMQVRKFCPPRVSAFESVRNSVYSRLGCSGERSVSAVNVVEIPVDFSREAALDLHSIAEYAGCGPDEVVEIFISRTYRVYMLGFLPGFAYMGEVDRRIATPRKQSPRLSVPKGSVGIAGQQTGVYPLESPGGWQIIGRTAAEMFRPADESSCLLSPGDAVRFVAA